jgi:hypothetical protein
MRRHGSGAGCGARGRSETHALRSGGAGIPPGGTRTSREELADGACCLRARGPEGSTLRKGSGPRAEGEAGKAAESAARLPEDTAMERRGAQRVDRKTRAALRKAWHYGRLAALHSLGFFRGTKGKAGVPAPQSTGAIPHVRVRPGRPEVQNS